MPTLQFALGIALLVGGAAMLSVGRARKGETARFLRNDFVAMTYLLVCLLFFVAGGAMVLAQVLA